MATSAGSIPISATFNSASLERDVLSALNRIQSKSTLKLNAKGFTEPLGRISGLASEFQKSLEASNARVVAFGASAGIIYNIQKAFNALISSTLETEKALIGINVVLNASSSTLNKFGNELFNIAKLTGSSFGEVASAATEFSRQGLALEDTLKRTRDALILTRLSGLDVVSSTEALTSAVNSFAKEALTTTDVVNKLAAVDAKFAVSSRDLSEAIKRVGSSASEAGVSFDELLGIVTSVQQTTARGGAVIGNALKTIFTRIQRPEVINDLRDFGVAVQDASGKALPVVQVLENLAGSFEKLNPVVKAQVGELVGGVFQINILKAALSDLSKENSIFASATRASTLALDDAIEKNKAYNESISSLINQTLVNFAQLGKNIGNVSIAPGIEKIIGVLNSALEDINEKDSQSVGAKIGTGLLKGITDFITGPGLIVGAAILGKLFKRFGGFTVDAAKNLLEINTVAQQQAAIQKGISQVLASNPALIGQILAGTKTRLQVEKEIKDILVEQSALAKQIADTSISSSRSLVGGGLSVSREGYVVRRKADGYIPNFNNEFSQEVFSARKLGAKGSVSAQLSQGTIDGKKFIKNSGEIEIVTAGRNGDSAVIPFYGGGMEKALGMIARGQSGSILNSRMSKGFVPNFAEEQLAIGDFKAYLKSSKEGAAFLEQNKSNFSKMDWYRNNPESVAKLKAYLADFNRINNSNFEISILKKFEDQLARGVAQAAKSGLPVDVIEKIRREKEINDLEVLKNPRVPPSINSAVLIARMESLNDYYNKYTSLETNPEPLTDDKKARLNKIKQEAANKYEEYAIGQLKTIGYPDVIAADALGLFGNAATRGGQSQTSVDAVSLDKQAFFEMKGGDIKTAQINDKFKRVRTDPGNFELLFKAKFGQDWSQAASPEELSLGKIWQQNPSVFDDLFQKRSKMRWTNVLVGSDYHQAAKSGNKFINLNPSKGGGAYVGMKETFGSLKETKTANAPEPIPLSDIPSFLSEESQRVIGKLGYPSNNKGFIPNLASKKRGKIIQEDLGDGRTRLLTSNGSELTFLSKGDSSRIEFEYVVSRSPGDGSALVEALGAIAKESNKSIRATDYLPQEEALNKALAEGYTPNSIEEVVALAYKQLKWGELGQAKNTLLTLTSNYSEYPLQGKSIYKQVVRKLYELYSGDQDRLLDDIMEGNIKITDIESTYSKGFIPNFNSPLKDSIAREVAAGYSPSQVRVGFSKSLATNFNPSGAGVYNASEGSLPAAMQLARNAGINPKTKGMRMASKGHIPNFAEFDSYDVTAIIGSLAFLGTQIKEVAKTIKENKENVKRVNDGLKTEVDSIKKSAKERVVAINDQLKKEKQNSDAVLKVYGDQRKAINQQLKDLKNKAMTLPFGLSPADQALEKALRSDKRKLPAGERKEKARIAAEEVAASEKRKKIAEETRDLIAEQRASAAAKLTPYARASQFVKSAGFGIGVAGAGVANIVGQFLPEQNVKGKAIASGLGDIASYAGTGAAVGGIPGAIGGALLGAASFFKKVKDADAETSLLNINKQLDALKDKSNSFSNASQTYANSLEQLQSALNDPKSRPETLIKFQTSIADALNQIPSEFRQKVLNAGSDITKVSDAIAQVTKELNQSQESLQAQADILSLVSKNKTLLGFGETVLNKKDQDIFNRLFTRNINRNELIKNFENPQNFSNFISGIQNQLVSTRTISRMTGNYNFQNQTFSEVNKQNLPQIKRELENRGLFSGEIANVFEEASKNTNVENINNLVEAIRKVGIEAFKSKEDAELFAATLKENTKINEKNAKTIKDLTDSFNNLNLQVSNQINIEKERSSTIRKINQIQTEGQISIQRAKVKGALEQAAPFITDQQKFQIQSELDLNEAINKQNSEVRGAVNEVLDSFTESLTRRTEELRSGIIPEILSPEKRTEDITRERRVFQQNLQELIPLIQKGFQNINQGGNVEQIRKELADVILTQVKFKPESAQLLVEELNKSFSSFQNKLAEIKAQGDIDLEIQKTQNRYQEKLVALNQNLAIAGGAGALNTTGTLGVSELFDRLSELTSELRQTAAIGTKAQRGSSTFKLLDILTNELQLGRISGGKAIGNELFPLIATSVQGRAEQIKQSAERAKSLTNIELIRSTGAGIGAVSELEKQFNQLNNNALEIAFDQIASQLKLQNIGDYFDLLTQESIYLNRLTEEQNKLLAAQTPDLNKNFNDVITTQVGDKLNTLNNNLLTQFKNLTVTTRVTDLQKQTRSLLPGNLPVDQQQKLLERISNLSSISALPLISTEDKKLPQLDLFSGLAKEFSTADVKITAETIKSIKSLFDEIKILNAELLAPSSKVAGSTQDQKTSASISSFDFVKNALYPLAPRNYVQPLKSPYLTQLEEIQRKREEDLQNQRNEFLKRINDAKSAGNEDLARQLELELEYKDKVKKIELSLKQAEQQIEVFETSRLGDLMFRSEKGAIYESAIEANARQGRVDVGNILKEGTTYNQADFARDTGETLKMFVADFKSGIGSAFSEAIKGTKSLRQAFADLFESLLNKLTDRATGQLVDAAFGAVEKGARSYFGGSKGGLMTSSGFIRGYNSGGLVTGGSGVRDDIPTMMNGGEFVIRKSSVNKYGEGFLSQLNQGIIPKRAGGGSFSLGPLQNEFVYNDPERPTSGEFRVDPRLSAFALTDENNPQNKIRQERYDKLEQYLIERDDYNRGIQKALDDFKKKVNGIFNQGLITAGVQIGAAGLVEGVKAGASSIGSGGEGGYSDSQYSSFGVPAGYGTSGGIRRAAGGYIARFGGGGSNKDNIPALLMGGEYVMSQKAVRNYGTNFMNQLNNGSIPKFADGGLVPNSNGSITTSTRNSGQNYSDNEALQALLVAINSLNDTISKGNDVTQAESGGAASRQINGSDQSGGMSIVNNISVNVTGSETNASVETNTQNQNQNNQLQNNAKLAEILKGKVLEVIVEQKRPGGLLASGRS
jgi:TP901 family phage tail tape measure protein